MKEGDFGYNFLGPFGQKVRDLTWEETKEIWRNNEADLEHWKTYWQSQGMNSWEEWRERFFQRFGTKDLAWTLMETRYSTSWVPLWSYANFRGWNKLAGASRYSCFSSLVKHSNLENYEPLVRLIDNFPKETTVIGIELQGDLYIIEGMHRCAAVAVANWQSKKLETTLKVAVGRKVGTKPRYLSTRILYPEAAELILRLSL